MITLAAHAQLRWDPVRHEHQIVLPERLLVLNETAAEIVRLAAGRTRAELLSELACAFDGVQAEEVDRLIEDLLRAGVFRDGAD
jgi:pyrroloquinoline quinone biosynthesis protein D